MTPTTSRDRDWIIPAALVVCAELGLWLVSYAAGYAYSPQVTEYNGVALACLTMVLAARLLHELWRMRGSGSPIAHLSFTLRSNPRRIAAILVGVQLVAIGSSAFGALKAAMPKTIDFWLDPYLLDLEHRLFGMHPFQLTAAIFGWATPALEMIYATFVPFQIMGTLFVLTAAPSQGKTKAMVSLFLAWLLLGVGGAYMLSSAGPIFYDRIFGGSALSGLSATLKDAPLAVITSDRLWHFHKFDIPVIANGISAMPSMHVALTMWLALVAARTRFAWLAWTYYGLMWLGSVHLGFHYVMDGLVSTFGMLIIWRVTPALSGKTNKLTLLHPSAGRSAGAVAESR